MKRSPLKPSSPDKIWAWRQRSEPMARTEIKRSGRITPVNRERKAAKFERNFGDRGAAVREMTCLVVSAPGQRTPCRGAIQAAHAKARGMGGCGGDRRSLVPLCARHHADQGGIGILTWQRITGIDLIAEAERVAAELDGQGYE